MPKEHVAIFALLCIIAFGAGYWHSTSKVDSDERVEVVAPPAPPTVVTNVVTNTVIEPTIVTNVITNTVNNIVTNIITNTVPVKPQPTPTPASQRLKALAQAAAALAQDRQIRPSANLQNAILEKAIRSRYSLNKPKGELTKADLEKVTFLNLHDTQIADAGLKEVAKLQKLTNLNLGGCAQIADAGLKELAKLQQLKLLILRDTQITKAGVAQLQKALPECNVESGFN